MWRNETILSFSLLGSLDHSLTLLRSITQLLMSLLSRGYNMLSVFSIVSSIIVGTPLVAREVGLLGFRTFGAFSVS